MHIINRELTFSMDQLASKGSEGTRLNFRALTQNCWMMPVRLGSNKSSGFCNSLRVEAFGNWLEDQEIAGALDVVLLQDLWDDSDSNPSCMHCLLGVKVCRKEAAITSTIAALFPHISQVDPQTSCFARNDHIASGLCVASKHPIINQTFFPYPTKSSGDSISKKGVLIVALALPDK